MAKLSRALVAGTLMLAFNMVLGQEKLSDPTAPLGYSIKSGSVKSYTLSSIFKSQTDTKAIVNGQLVKLGDSVDGGKVIAISDVAVAVETKDGVQRLVLHRQIKKNSATQ